MTSGIVTEIERWPLERLIPHARNARTHSEEQVAQIAGSIAEFGFVNPVLVGDDGVIVAGHGRVLAARKLGLAEVPVIVLSHLTPTQRRALMIADNRIARMPAGMTRCWRPSWRRSGTRTSTSACSASTTSSSIGCSLAGRRRSGGPR